MLYFVCEKCKKQINHTNSDEIEGRRYILCDRCAEHWKDNFLDLYLEIQHKEKELNIKILKWLDKE